MNVLCMLNMAEKFEIYKEYGGREGQDCQAQKSSYFPSCVTIFFVINSFSYLCYRHKLCLQLYTDFVEMGHGTFGTVYRARAKADNKIFVIKKVENTVSYKSRKNKNSYISAPKEVHILQNAKYSNIIKYFGAFPQNQKFYIVMEFANKRTLASQNMDWNEKSIWEFLTQMASALDYLHQERIIHWDVKPDNILCISENNSTMTFKLSDFGTAKVFDKNKLYTNTYCGTPGYMASEVVFRENYTFSADIWSLGAVMSFVCNNGIHLFNDKYDVMRWLGTEDPLPRHFNSFLRNIVNRLLRPNYEERPSAALVYRTANDHWSTLI